MTALPTFIPAQRLLHMRQRRRRAAWLAVVTGYGLAVLIVCLPSVYLTGSRIITSGEEVRSLESRIAEARQSADRLTASAASSEASLRLATSLTGHADWSRLFPVLSSLLLDRATLHGVSLEPEAATGDRYTLLIRGAALDQRAVSDIALAFEQRGLFTAVRVVESRIGSGGAAEFALRSTIAPRPRDTFATAAEETAP